MTAAITATIQTMPGLTTLLDQMTGFTASLGAVRMGVPLEWRSEAGFHLRIWAIFTGFVVPIETGEIPL